jgi:hypothetical protein
MPALAQDIVTVSTGLAVLVLYAVGLWLALSARRDSRWLILLLAASATVFMEPFACFMVEAHHPAVGAYVLLRGLGVTVPLQLLFFYILYFAPTAVFLIWRAKRGIPMAAYVLDLGGITVLLFGAEALAIHFGLWFFFGYNPFVVLGLPLWVALTNIASVYAWAATAAYCLYQLQGAWKWSTVAAAPFSAIAVYGPISLPAAIALHTPGAGYAHTGPAAVMSAGIALVVILAVRHLLGKAIAVPRPDRSAT